MLTAGKSIGQFSLYCGLHRVKIIPHPRSLTRGKSLTLVFSPEERDDVKIEAEEPQQSEVNGTDLFIYKGEGGRED